MKKTLAAYWHKEGLDVYRYDGDRPVRYASGSLEQPHSIKERLHKMVLIVGRERLMHIRKRYPLAPLEKLTKAVALEIKDLFPLSRPAFYCRVGKSFSAYVEMDIWAWESDTYEQLRAAFPFDYVLPEDLAFPMTDARIRIYPWRQRINLLAHMEGRFLEGLTYPEAGFDEETISRFLFNLAHGGDKVDKATIYGLPALRPSGDFPTEVTHLPASPVPPCIHELGLLDLGPFKVKTEMSLTLGGVDPLMIMRIGLYLVLGYALMLSLTWHNYNQAITAVKAKTTEMSRKLSLEDKNVRYDDASAVIEDIRARLRGGVRPIDVMNLMARRLPEGSFINRLACNENNIEISASAKNPLAIVKALSNDAEVRKVGIKGAPTKDFATGMFNFMMTLELR